jgi:hypothetical protein
MNNTINKHITNSVLAEAPTQIAHTCVGHKYKQYKPTSSWGGQNAQFNSEDMLLTRDQLSTRWNYCIETLKRWEKAGNLPFLKLGKEVRYRQSIIEDIEKKSEVRL